MPAPKLIIGPAEVRARYSLEDLEDINTSLDSGLEGAHTQFQTVLGTRFEVLTQSDVFYTDDGVIPAVNKQFRLRLKNAFVKEGSAVITMGDTRRDLLSAPVVVSSDDYFVDASKGLVFVDALGRDSGVNYAKRFIGVAYTSGFGAAAGLQQPPAWLKEAVLVWMSSILLYNQFRDKPDKAVPLADKIQRNACAMIDAYKRETALQFTPLY